jgi:serine/threonine-protein kinase
MDPGERVIQQNVTYALRDQIHAGGMSEIFEAFALGVNGFKKRVALKFLDRELAEHPDLLSNFIGEAKLVADLIHANIGQIYNLGIHEGRFFIAMEYIDGVSLRQFALQHQDLERSIPGEMAVFLMSRVVRGLAYAHEKRDEHGRPLGLVHRDVTPGNVMLSFEGDVKLVDFGVAKARSYMVDAEERMIAGKIDYMSPEQITFRRTDSRSDIFSACVVLVELLTGEKLFPADSLGETRTRLLTFEPGQLFSRHPEIFRDSRLRAILEKGLARDPARRFGATRELLVELELLIYSGGYGPTNESLAAYLRELFPGRSAEGAPRPSDPTVIVR